jgi:RHS repeat-associated protein
MVEMHRGDSTHLYYQYDFDGRLIQSHDDQGVKQYVYDQTARLMEYGPGGSFMAKYDYAADRLLRMTHYLEGERYYHVDALGSPTLLTDPFGAPRARYHLDAWGVFRNPVEATSSQNRFGYTGYIYSPLAKLYLAKARFYDPEVGRFTSQDSFLGKIDQVPSLHRYAYGWNRPTLFVDPSGHHVEIIVGRSYISPVNGEWHSHGHVALRVYDPTDEAKYDSVYDYGRYGWTPEHYPLVGEGILNVFDGRQYIARESWKRENIGYVVETDATTDRRIVEYFQKLMDRGVRRKDLEAKSQMSGAGVSYQIDAYDAAPFLGINRSTCVSKSRDGCLAGNDERLDVVARALTSFAPRKVEENLEDIFDNRPTLSSVIFGAKASPITKRNSYHKGDPIPYVVMQDEHQKAIDADAAILVREREEREKAWREPEQIQAAPKEAR